MTIDDRLPCGCTVYRDCPEALHLWCAAAKALDAARTTRDYREYHAALAAYRRHKRGEGNEQS